MTPVVPAGSPPWTRTATIERFGGALDKQNYLGRGPIDALTDTSAEGFARLTNDAAAVVPVIVTSFGRLIGSTRVVDNALTPTGVRSVPYAIDTTPPVGFPRVDRVDVGSYVVTIPAELTDAYGVTAPVAIQHVKPGNAVHSAVCRVVASVASATTITLKIIDAADTPLDPDNGIAGLSVY